MIGNRLALLVVAALVASCAGSGGSNAARISKPMGTWDATGMRDTQPVESFEGTIVKVWDDNGTRTVLVRGEGGAEQAIDASGDIEVEAEEAGQVVPGQPFTVKYKVHLPMTVHWNSRKVGQPDCGTDMVFDFGQLIAHICKTRNVRAGSIVGSGTISNVDRKKGYCCIAEKRMLETIDDGKPATEFMKFGDAVKIEMFDAQGHSVFGAIDQLVAAPRAGN